MAALAGCGIQQRAGRDRRPRSADPRRHRRRPSCAAFLARGLRQLQRAGPRARGAASRSRSATAAPSPGWSRRRRRRSTFDIDFADRAIGRQEKTLEHGQRRLRARTCRQPHLLPAGRRRRDAGQGLALGGTCDNAVVVDGDRVLSPGGLRHADEAVRHKMLDALGDLALAGRADPGRYTGDRAGPRDDQRAAARALRATRRLPHGGLRRGDGGAPAGRGRQRARTCRALVA